jgi:predicted phage terminase large subunit-like protein
MVTVRYPVWRMECDPSMRVVVGAYSQTLANRFSRKSRRIAKERLALDPERTAVEEWETTAGGTFRAIGVGAGITGQGGHLIVIDDPVKSREEASSEAYRDRVWEWYTDDLYTRLEPDASVILIMTRWHADDLAGRILASEDAHAWTTINLPAEAEANDPLGREMGEALCPDRYDEEALARIHKVLGNSYYALYQQRPTPPEGGMFKRPWFEIVKSAPFAAERVRYWDKAGTQDGGAYSCGALLVRDKTGVFYVEDVIRGQWSALDRESVIKQTTAADAARYGNVTVWQEQEPGSGGKESAEATVRNLAGYVVRTERVTGDKVTRAEPLAAQCEARNVKLVEGAWNHAYLEELTSFPHGKYKDQVDASSGAFNKLAQGIGMETRELESAFGWQG